MAESPSAKPSDGYESGLNGALVKAIADCRDCVQKLRDEFVESGMPITDDNTALHRLSAKLEFLLQAHLKVRSGVIGKKKDYWEYMTRCLATRRSIHDGIKFVKTCPDYKTSLGRGRALLRFCLVHQCLADTMQQCIMDGEATSSFYKPCSPLLRHEMSSDLLDSLYVLNEVKFDLNPTGHDLDVAWPTFSRVPGAGMFNWRPPSRAMSISSLDSSFSTSYDNVGPGLSSSLGDFDERHEAELVAYKVEVADLRNRIDGLVAENESLKRTSGYDKNLSIADAGTETSSSVESVGETPVDATASENISLKKLVQTLRLKLASCEVLLDKTGQQNAALRKVAEMSQELATARSKQLEELRLAAASALTQDKCDAAAQTDPIDIDRGGSDVLEEKAEKLNRAVELMKEITRLKTEENEALKEQLRCAYVATSHESDSDFRQKQRIAEMDRQISALKEALKLSKELLRLRTEETESLRSDLDKFAARVAEDKAACDQMHLALKAEADAREVEQQEAKNKLSALEEALTLTKRVLALKSNGEEETQVKCDAEAQTDTIDIDRDGSGLIEEKAEKLNRAVELMKEITRLKTEENEALKEQLRCASVTTAHESDPDFRQKQRIAEMDRQISALKEALKLSKELLRLRTEESESLRSNLDEVAANVAEDKAACEQMHVALKAEANAREAEQQEAKKKLFALEEALALTKRVLALKSNGGEKECISSCTQTGESQESDKFVELQRENRTLKETVAVQERRLSSVTLELSRMWMLLFNLKTQHNKLLDDETFRRCELGEKRKYLAKLRLDLERSRSRSVYARSLNEDSARQFDDMRVEFRLRKTRSAEETLVPGTPPDPSVDIPATVEAIPPDVIAAASVPDFPMKGSDRLSRLEAACKDLHAHLATNASKGLELDTHLARIIKMKNAVHVYPSDGEDYGDSKVSSPEIVVTDESLQVMESLLRDEKRKNCEDIFEDRRRKEREQEQKLQAGEAQLTNLRACLEARDREMHDLSIANSTLKDEIESLQVQLASQARDYERAVEASESAQKELARLAAAMNEQEAVISALEAKLAEFEVDRSTELDRSIKLNETLQEELSEKSMVADELERRVEQYAAAISSLRKSVAAVRVDLSHLGTPVRLRKCGVSEASVNGLVEDHSDGAASDNEDGDVDVIVAMEGKIRGLAECVQKHVVEFDADNRLLREGLVRLLKEKDKLWHHNNRLVQLFRNFMRNDLGEDDAALNCSSCGAPFSLMLRRHHCRLCGKFFCYACSDHYLSLAATRGRTRVCRHCFGLVQKINLDGNSSFAQDDNEPNDDDDDEIDGGGDGQSGDPNSEGSPLSSTGLPVTNGELLVKPRNVGFEETAAPIMSLPRQTPPIRAGGEEKFTVISGGEIASIRAEAAECPPHIMCPTKIHEPLSLADLVQPDSALGSCSNSISRGSTPAPSSTSMSRSSSREPSRDMTQLDESVVTSSVTGERRGSLFTDRRSSDVGYPYSVEFWVTARSSLGVPVSLPIQPCVIDWRVDIQGQMDLNFAVTYRTSLDVGLTESLHKIQRLVDGRSRGQLKVRRPGLYTFVFDNTYSSLKAKKVTLQLRLEKETGLSRSPLPPSSSSTPKAASE